MTLTIILFAIVITLIILQQIVISGLISFTKTQMDINMSNQKVWEHDIKIDNSYIELFNIVDRRLKILEDLTENTYERGREDERQEILKKINDKFGTGKEVE